MNYIALAIILITVLPVVFGLLLGLMRGWRRSLLRLVLVLVAAVLAFTLCGVVGNAVLGIEVEGQTLREAIVQQVEQAMQGVDISDLAVAIVESLVKVLVFLLMFALLLFLTWTIVYPICKIFVKPGRNREGVVKKRRLIGAGIGLVQGAVVGLCFALVLSGLLAQVGKVGQLAGDFDDIGQSQTADSDMDDEQYSDGASMDETMTMFVEYAESPVCKFYDNFNTVFGWVSNAQVTTDGKTRTVTLSGTVDALQGVAKMAKQFARLSDAFDGTDIKNANVDDIKDIFAQLDSINGDLSSESRRTITDTLKAVGDSMDLPLDLDDIDFDRVDFSREGEVITDLLEYSKQDSISKEEADKIVDDILDSDLVLPALSGSGVDGSGVLNDQQKDVVSQVLTDIEQEGQISPEKKDKIDQLRDLLGI